MYVVRKYHHVHVLVLLQELEEPGEDDTRYDTIQLPLVHPPKKQKEDLTDDEYSKRCHSPWEPAKERKEEEEEEGVQLGILKQFTFSSELQVLLL